MPPLLSACWGWGVVPRRMRCCCDPLLCSCLSDLMLAQYWKSMPPSHQAHIQRHCSLKGQGLGQQEEVSTPGPEIFLFRMSPASAVCGPAPRTDEPVGLAGARVCAQGWERMRGAQWWKERIPELGWRSQETSMLTEANTDLVRRGSCREGLGS